MARRKSGIKIPLLPFIDKIERLNSPETPWDERLRLIAELEKAGWKGKRKNEHGVHANQALVLVNYGSAKGEDINRLSEEIKLSVSEKFGIDLEKEVNVF